MCEVIAVVSGKGGVGKSTVTASISFALALKNYKILAIDADVGLRNLDLLLGVEDAALFDFSDVLSGKCPFNKAVQVHPQIPSLHFLTAPQISAPEDISLNALQKICSLASGHFDYIFIDSPAGIGSGFLNAALASDRALIVATPDYTSIRDADRVAGLLVENGINDVRLIINRVRVDLMRKGLIANIDDMIDSISVKLIGIIPEDAAVIVECNAGKPVVLKKSMAAKAVDNIARRIIGEDVKLYKFWKRF